MSRASKTADAAADGSTQMPCAKASCGPRAASQLGDYLFPAVTGNGKNKMNSVETSYGPCLFTI